MRSKAHKFKCVVVSFAVDQNEVRLDMAIAAIISLTNQGMIDRVRRQGLVRWLQIDDAFKQDFQLFAMLSRFLSSIVTLEAAGELRAYS